MTPQRSPSTTRSAAPAAQTAQTEGLKAEDVSFLRSYAGRFIVFEGPDGSGKSTQFRRLAEALRSAHVPTTEVREPGGTPVGERIRDVLLRPFNESELRAVPAVGPRAEPGAAPGTGPDASAATPAITAHDSVGMSVRCEMLLYMASRAELVEHVVLPALKRGELVLADRFVASTLAYQGAAGGLPASDISAVARVATRNLQPDLVVIFDLDHHAAAKRMGLLLDRMEAKGAAFHSKVREGYLALAKSDPGRYAVVDAARGPDEVWAQLLGTLRDRAATLSPISRAGKR